MKEALLVGQLCHDCGKPGELWVARGNGKFVVEATQSELIDGGKEKESSFGFLVYPPALSQFMDNEVSHRHSQLRKMRRGENIW